MLKIRELSFFIAVAAVLLAPAMNSNAQERLEVVNYGDSREYVLAGITVSGVQFLDANALIGLSGLRTGQRVEIPGHAFTDAVKRLMGQGLFADVRITLERTEGQNAYINIELTERPRLSQFNITGVRRGEIQDITDAINLVTGTQITSHMINSTKNIIENYFIDKGFLHPEILFLQRDDPDNPNGIILTIDIDKGERVRISEINFIGAEEFSQRRLRRVMKDTRQRDWNIFKASRFVEKSFREDKRRLAEFYNENGFRDFEIISDSLYIVSEDRVALDIKVDEGKRYYLRDIEWIGNSKYSTEDLEEVFGIERGAVYNPTLIESRLRHDEDAVGSLYLDNGYLFSNVTPVESRIDGDSIDIQVRIYEGDQAYLNNIIISGNSRTNEHVARRELYTLPGDLFSKERIIRSARQLAVLGHFDPEQINPQPIPNPAAGTVDLHYELEEQANDQFEISGGWGAGMLVGTVGVRFNNFAMREFFNPSAWRPYPSGDGQSLSIRAQSNGRIYQSYSISFMEPWLGGTKPNTLTTSIYRSIMTNGQRRGEDNRQSMIIDGGSVGFGKRLVWPDDFFSVNLEASYQRYSLNNYEVFRFLFKNGVSNMFSLTTRLTRHSAGPNPIYPTRGSTFSLSLQATPPYSLISGKDFSDVPDTERYRWIEFYKWVAKGDYYYSLVDRLVLSPRFAFGYLGHYNNDIGPSPFENFYVGGDGMTGYSFYGRDVIALRGYENGSLTPTTPDGIPQGNVYSKLTLELRYPITLNPQASVYGLMFLEAGKAWNDLGDFNPFRMNRSAGIGLRANLPMFGLLGLDWGYGFDPVPGRPGANGGHFHFVMGQQF